MKERLRLRVRVRIFLMVIQLLIFHYSLLIETPATIRYVSKTGSSTPPYTSWATAADSIQKCINICENGDTIIIGVGTFREQIIINRQLAIWGVSMDSTIIQNPQVRQGYPIIELKSDAYLENFTIKDNNSNYYVGIMDDLSHPKLIVRNCKFLQVFVGIALLDDTRLSEIINCIFINNGSSALHLRGKQTVRDNLIFTTESASGIDAVQSTGPRIINNIIIDSDERNGHAAINSFSMEFFAYNNLISGYESVGISVQSLYRDSIINNILTGQKELYYYGNGAISSLKPSVTTLRNNILFKNRIGVASAVGGPLFIDYQNFYNNTQNTQGLVSIGNNNLVNIDPMFVNDTVVTLTSNWDYHLQAFSPAIDKGDPSILDRDGSRSDIGMYGGPFGEIYTYQDLAPRPPRNLSAIVDNGRVKLKWNKNTEADTSHYNIYRSLTPNFIIDSTKLIGTTKDTNFVDILTQTYERLYYKLTCVDKQGNQSKASEELMVNLTSINEYPTLVNDYYLYQNYPNPFNGSTIISYKLKERGYVKLMVYDIKGERVAVLVNEEQESGYYEVAFDVNSLEVGNRQLAVGNAIASGIYLYRIEVIGEGNIPVYTEMRKMVLVK